MQAGGGVVVVGLNLTRETYRDKAGFRSHGEIDDAVARTVRRLF